MYGVTFVEDHELPEKDWGLARMGRRTRLFIRRSAVDPKVLEQAWAAFRAVTAEEAQSDSPAREATR